MNRVPRFSNRVARVIFLDRLFETFGERVFDFVAIDGGENAGDDFDDECEAEENGEDEESDARFAARADAAEKTEEGDQTSGGDENVRRVRPFRIGDLEEAVVFDFEPNSDAENGDAAGPEDEVEDKEKILDDLHARA